MAIRLNGVADWLSFPSVLVAAPPFTFVGWLKSPPNNDGTPIVAMDDAGNTGSQVYAALLDQSFAGSPGPALFQVGEQDPSFAGASASSARAVAPSTWHHYAGAMHSDGATVDCWVDGGQHGTASSASAWSTYSPSLAETLIGCLPTFGPFPGMGLLADVAIYGALLTQAEIIALYRGARPWQVRPAKLIACVAGETSVNRDLMGRLWTINGAPMLTAEMPPAIQLPKPLAQRPYGRLSGSVSDTVPVSGVSAACSVGSAVPTDALGASGAQASAALGALGPSVGVAASGASASATAAAIPPRVSALVSGVLAASGIGSPAITVAGAVTGSVAAASAGTVQGGRSIAIAGLSLTCSAGAGVPAIADPLVGSAAAASAASLTPAEFSGVTGATAAAMAGALSPQDAAAVTGVQAAAGVGAQVQVVQVVLVGIQVAAATAAFGQGVTVSAAGPPVSTSCGAFGAHVTLASGGQVAAAFAGALSIRIGRLRRFAGVIRFIPPA